MKASKADFIKILNITENTFRKKSFLDKKKMAEAKGYLLTQTIREGKDSYYILEPEEKYIKVREYLDEFGFDRIRNQKVLINALIVWNINPMISANKMGEIVGISGRTVLTWRRKLEEKDILHVMEKAVPTKNKLGELPILVGEEEWKDYLKKAEESGMNYMDFYFYHGFDTKYYYKKSDLTERNGFFNEFFELLNEYAKTFELELKLKGHILR